jgi:hypothetical protein
MPCPRFLPSSHPACRQPRAIRTEYHACRAHLPTFQFQHLAPSFDLPHSHSVAVSRGEAAAVRTERHTHYVNLKAFDGAERVARRRIPQAQSAVVACGSEYLAVRAECQILDSAIMPFERQKERRRLTVPDFHRGVAIAPGGSDACPIRTKDRPIDLTRMPFEGEKRLVADNGLAVIARRIAMAT